MYSSWKALGASVFAIMLGLLSLSVAGLRADTITILDTAANDQIFLQFPTNLAVVTLPDSTAEFLHFTVDAGNVGDGEVLVTDWTEPGDPSTISDRLIVFLDPNSTLIDVKFASDPSVLDRPQDTTSYFSFVEDGTPQSAGYTIFRVTNAVDGTLEFQVASDVDNAVPEPATLTLLAIGAVGMCGYGWRRRKMVAA